MEKRLAKGVKYMKKGICFILSAICLLGLTACKKDSAELPQHFPAQVENVTIDKRPEKVVSLSPNLTKIIYELGLQSQLVGRSDEAASPEAVKELPSVGGSSEPEIQKILDLKPQIVLSQSPLAKKDVEVLSGAGIQLVVIPAAGTVEALEKLYSDTATVLDGKINGPAKAKLKYDEIQSGLKQITDLLPGKKSFLYLVSLDGTVATPDTFESSVLSLFGQNVAEGTGYSTDLSAAKAKNPEVLFVSKPYAKQHLEKETKYKDFNAVKNSAVYSIDKETFAGQNEDLVDAARLIAETLYPKIDFPTPDTSTSQTSSGAKTSSAASGSTDTSK